MNPYAVSFLAALALCLGLRAALAGRQIAHLRAHRSDVPAAFENAFSGKAHATATDYAIAKARLEVAAAGLDSLLLLFWTLGGGLALLDQVWAGFALPASLAGAAVVASSVVLLAGLRLPVLGYRLFVVDTRFGLNRTSPALFLMDAVRQLGLLGATGFLLAALALWLMEGAGTYGWLTLWILWIAVQLLKTWAYPTLVTPLFNRLAPLPEGPLRARLAALAARSGYALENVAVMDGSRRSSHANAHVTGTGRAKRVVLLDTLVEALEPVEVEAVTAHEIGHLARRHMEKYQAAQALVTLLWIFGFGQMAGGFGQMAGQDAFFAGLGLGAASPHLALAVLLAISPVFGLLAKPATCLLLRRFEIEADAYAARHSDPAALCRALLRLSRRNVSPLSASPAYAAFHHSHPALPVRVEKLTALAEATGTKPIQLRRL